MDGLQSTRKFKRINLLGLDFYVDWLDINGMCERIICVKEVYSGKIFVFKDVVVNGVSFEDMIYNALNIQKYEEPKKIVADKPAAQVTEQPKEEASAKKGKGRIKRG